MRFSSRFTLLFGVLAIGLAALLWWTVSMVVDRSVEDRALDRLRREADYIALEISDTPANRLDPVIRRMSRSLGLRVTVIAPDGRVIDDSDVAAADVPRMQNHGSRPEVVQARTAGTGFSIRHSTTLGFDLFYLAQRLPHGAGFVRVALPYAELRHLESKYEWIAGGVILLACALLFAIGSIAGRALTGPIGEVASAALAVSRGEVDREPPANGPREIVELSSAIQQMKTSLLEGVEKLEAERRLADAVFRTLPDGIVVVDRQWKIIDANPAFGRMLDASSAPGRALAEVVREREMFEIFERTTTGHRPVTETLERPGGATWVVSVHPVEGSRRAAAVGILHDMTEMKRNEALRRRFVADVSHELRTPIASIAAAAETLGGLDPEDPEVPRLIEVIQRQSARTRELIEDLTDLSLIESGQTPISSEPVELWSLAREVAADFAPAVEARGTAVHVEGDPPVMTRGDARRIAQILRNLVDNAVKFSPDGAPVTIAVRQTDDAAVLEVRDTGIGIAPRERDRIFQRFYQVDRSRSKSRPGTGLGLAIVKHLAQIHGASVSVESTPGAGSTFTVRLPRYVSTDQQLTTNN